MAISQQLHPAPGLISVIMPVRDGADTIREQLAALDRQRYTANWEIVVADNGSLDATPEIVRTSAPRRVPLRLVDASARAGSSFARNVGAAAAAGEFLVFCDADDVVAPGWLGAMAAAACNYDVVTGRQDETELNSPAVQASRPPRPCALPTGAFLPYAPSCNLGVWADVYRSTGGFKEEYPQAHDVEWSWRAQLENYSLGYAADAIVHYRYRTTLRAIARQAYLSGLDSARLYRDYRDRGMKRPRLRASMRVWLWIIVRSPYLATRMNRGLWIRRAAETWGRLRGSVRFRVVFL